MIFNIMKALELYHIDIYRLYSHTIASYTSKGKRRRFAASPCWISKNFTRHQKHSRHVFENCSYILYDNIVCINVNVNIHFMIVDKLKPKYWFIDFINDILKSWVWEMQWVMR